MKYKLKCIACGKIENNFIITCSSCGGALETLLQQIDDHNSCQYRSLLPFSKGLSFTKYFKVMTPITRIYETGYAKLEYQSVTQSSKTREAIVELSMAKKLGYKGIIVASTGNMAIALAMLSVQINFPCYIYVPHTTSQNKIKILSNYKANIEVVDGNYDKIVSLVRKKAEKDNLFLASLQAFRFDGYKTIAYEIFEQLPQIPENIIVPMGDGTTYVGIYKGFQDLRKMGLIKRIPRMIGVQEVGCDPIVRVYYDKKVDCEIDPIPSNILCESIKIGSPLDGIYAVKVARETDGCMYSYDSTQIKKAQRGLLGFGIDAEFTSATTYCPVLFNGISNYILIITSTGGRN